MDLRFPTPLDKVKLTDSRWKDKEESQEKVSSSKFGKPRGRYMKPENTTALTTLASLEENQIICLISLEEITAYKQILHHINRHVIRKRFKEAFQDRCYRSILSRNPLKLFIIRVK